MFYTIQYIKQWLKSQSIDMNDIDIVNKYGRFIPKRLKIAGIKASKLKEIIVNDKYTIEEADLANQIERFMTIAISNNFDITNISDIVGKSKTTIRNYTYGYIKSYYPEHAHIVQKSRARAQKFRDLKDKCYNERRVNGELPQTFGEYTIEDKVSNKGKKAELRGFINSYIINSEETTKKELKSTPKNTAEPKVNKRTKKKASNKKAQTMYGGISYKAKNEEEEKSIQTLIRYLGRSNIAVLYNGEVHIKVSTSTGFKDLVLHSNGEGKAYVVYKGTPHEIKVVVINTRKIIVI